MKKISLFRVVWALPVLAMCAACAVALETDYGTEKSWAERGSTKTIVISASMEEPSDETKTLFDGTQIVWKTGDKIKLFDASHPTGVEFTLDPACDGQRVGTFTGSEMAATGPYYAVYPASAAGTLTGTSVSVEIPKSQALASGSFGDKANIAVGKVDNLSQGFAFKNVLGAVKISLSSDITAKGVRIETKGSESLWGTATVSMSGDVPSITALTNTAFDKQIIEATGNVTGNNFFVMLPPGALAYGFMAQVVNGEDKAMIKSAQASPYNQIVRSGIVEMPAFDYVAQINAAFLNLSAVPFGYYSGLDGATPTTLFSFAKATSSYASKVVVDTDRTFRVQDFSTGKMYSFVLPYTLALGGSYAATVESVVGSTYTAPAAAGSFTLVQKTANAGWFVKDDNTSGFIFLLED